MYQMMIVTDIIVPTMASISTTMIGIINTASYYYC